jgi:Xaa-Pro aminopeptidase
MVNTHSIASTGESMPASTTDYLRIRREKAQESLLKYRLNGVIIHKTSDIFHFTNWTPPSWIQAFLVLSSDRLILVSPVSPAGVDPTWDQTVTYTAFDLNRMVDPGLEATKALKEALSQLQLVGKPVGARIDALQSSISLELGGFINLFDSSWLMTSLLSIKDERAQAEIRKRIAMLDLAFENACQVIQSGISELEVFETIFTNLVDSLGAPFLLECDIGFGANTLTAEPRPTSKRLLPGETVLIDLYPNLGGYVADYTRNFVAGKPSGGQLDQHKALEQALSSAEKILRPGVMASEIDRIVRSSIEEAGYGKFIYQHHTGHAFGLTSPESPMIVPANPSRILPGMIIAIEPGIYHPIQGGMRLEGNYLITEDGFETLDGFPRRLSAVEPKGGSL